MQAEVRATAAAKRKVTKAKKAAISKVAALENKVCTDRIQYAKSASHPLPSRIKKMACAPVSKKTSSTLDESCKDCDLQYSPNLTC